MTKKSILQHIFIGLIFVCLTADAALAQTTEFSYQGQLKSSSAPANGNYDFEFLLFDAVAGGAQIGSTLPRNAVAVANGIFSVNLDFGGQFPGANRFLEIRVRPTGGGAFTPLAPRQMVNSSPYSVQSLNATNATNATTATTATNATQLGGVAANQYVITTDPRMSDARTPTAGSANYVQNTTVQQAASNFNISGTGTANILNAATQYNIGGQRVLSVAGTENIFAGVGAGAANTTGGFNSYFGRDAGQANTTGGENSFFGRGSGFSNTTGGFNSFFGVSAGFANTTGLENSFFGVSAGFANTTGFNNSFFGVSAGQANTTGGDNSFFGRTAGPSNTTGINNSFFGIGTGFVNTTGGSNSFFGRAAGFSNTTGSNNTIIGDGANVGSGNLTFATAIGSDAVATTSNTIQLGRPALDNVVAANRMAVRSIPLLASTAQVCFNAVGDLLQCGASSLRLKQNVRPYRDGLEILLRLRPIAFNWNEDGRPDIGLGAEDVAQVAPSFVFRNEKGEAEGVKYERLNILLINAVKDQQTQIQKQQELIMQLLQRAERQEQELEALKKLIFRSNSRMKACL